jgi:hypothetical protein
MIIKLRKMIAFSISLVLVVISLGFLKPNFTGESTVYEASVDETTISSTIKEKKKG